MFEHKRHKLLPFHQFLVRMLRFAFYAFILICCAIMLGVLGYHYFAGLGWIDSFYNASMILTGMGPVADLTTDTAKIFASFYALFSGIAFLTTVAVLFAPVVHRLMHMMHIDDVEDAGS